MATTTINLGLSLDGLSNVDSTGKATGDVLEWNSVSGNWEAATPSGGGGTPAGSNGEIQFNNSGAFGADSLLVWDNTNKRLGVGASPATTVRLDVRAQGALSTDIAFRVRNSANTINSFYVTGAGGVFSHGKTGITTNLVFGSNTALQFSAGANNIAIGNSMSFHTSGSRNVAIGNNNVLGGDGNDCVAVGNAAGNGGATESTLIGSGGSGNFTRSIKVGFNAALFVAATDSVFIGNSAGSNFTGGGFNTVNSQSVLIGGLSKTLANSDTNEIVIGYNTTGAGSNTATIGNTSIVKTILRGTLNAANLPTSPVGLVTGDIWNNLGILTIV